MFKQQTMAPLQENGNNGNILERAIQAYLAQYVEHEYTEAMYREQAGQMFEVLNNLYPIENPEIAFRRVNSYRAVMAEYAHIVPLFELEAFGM